MHLLSHHTDSELIQLLEKGSEPAFDEIYRRYWKKVFNDAFRRLHDQQLCEEIVQDVFIDLWNSRQQREIDALLPYLLTAAKYQVFAQYKKRKHLPFFEEPLDHIAVSPYHSDSKCFEKELLDTIGLWLDTQPEARRKIFRMRYLEGMETREIADELSLSQKTVQNQLNLAKGNLRLSILKHLVNLLIPLFVYALRG